MSKIFVTTAIAMVLAAGVPVAKAQTAANHGTRAVRANEILPNSVQPDEVAPAK